MGCAGTTAERDECGIPRTARGAPHLDGGGGGAHDQVDETVAVDVARDGRAAQGLAPQVPHPLLVRGERQARGRADAAVQDRPTGALEIAGIVQGGPDEDVGDPVLIDVAERREDLSVPARSGRGLVAPARRRGRPRRTPGEEVRGPLRGGPDARSGDPHQDVVEAVAVEVAGPQHREPRLGVSHARGPAPSGAGGRLLTPQHHVGRAPVRVRVLHRRADGEVSEAVAVDVPEGGERRSEGPLRDGADDERPGRRVEARGPAAVHRDRAHVHARDVEPRHPDGQVRVPVAVEILRGERRAREVVGVSPDADGRAAQQVGEGVRRPEVDRPGPGPAEDEPGAPHGDGDAAVAIEVRDRQRRPQALELGVAVGLRGGDRHQVGGGRGGGDQQRRESRPDRRPAHHPSSHGAPSGRLVGSIHISRYPGRVSPGHATASPNREGATVRGSDSASRPARSRPR